MASSLTQAGVAGGRVDQRHLRLSASVVASSASRRPLGRAAGRWHVLTTTYSVLPSADSAGAQLVAGLTRLASPVTAAAATQVAAAVGADARDAAAEPAGLGAVDDPKPKKTLPARRR